MAEMIKAIKLTPHDPNVHLKLSDVLSQGSIILGFPCLSDDQVKKNADQIRKLLSSQTSTTAEENIEVQLVEVQIKKNTLDHVNEAIKNFNTENEGINVTVTLVKILTDSLSHKLAVRDTKEGDNGYPLFFDAVPDTDLVDISPAHFFRISFLYGERGVSIFTNIKTLLPMGTLPSSNRHDPVRLLFAYNPFNIGSDEDGKPPNEFHKHLKYWAEKALENSDELVNRFFFLVGGGGGVVYIHLLNEDSNQRVSTTAVPNDDRAVITHSEMDLSIEPTTFN